MCFIIESKNQGRGVMQKILDMVKNGTSINDIKDFMVGVVFLLTGEPAGEVAHDVITILPARDEGVRLVFRDGFYHQLELWQAVQFLDALEDPRRTREAYSIWNDAGQGYILFRWATLEEAKAGSFKQDEYGSVTVYQPVVRTDFNTGEILLIGKDSREKLIQILKPIVAVGGWRALAHA